MDGGSDGVRVFNFAASVWQLTHDETAAVSAGDGEMAAMVRTPANAKKKMAVDRDEKAKMFEKTVDIQTSGAGNG